jgi:integrase/recombinase XerC
MLSTLHDDFIQGGLYLRGWSERTPPVYRRAFTSLQQSLATSAVYEPREGHSPHISKAQLEAWVVSMRKRGLSPACCNIYIRAVNAFCSWLHEQGHLRERVRLGQLKAHSKPVRVFTEAEVRALLARKPRRRSYLRTWLVALLMLDTGVRIDEALGLKAEDVDFDSLLLTVLGKGGKVRRVPFSAELRRHLWPYMREVGEGWVFGTRNATRVSYRNAYRNLKACFRAVGVEGAHVHPHNCRHSFACNFVRTGGSPVALSRVLGHSSILVTQQYLRGLQAEDFERRSRTLLAAPSRSSSSAWPS